MIRAGTLLLTLSLILAGCGEGVLIYGGRIDDNDENETVTVAGTVDDITPPNAIRDIVVFVYTNLPPEELQSPPPFNNQEDIETVLLASDKTFSLSDIARGDLTVVFLMDNPVNEADGSLDAGDRCAVLSDPDGDLRGIEGRQRVDISNVDINFNADDQPECGTATVSDGDIDVSTPADEQP